jgi:hypothetical protein
MTYDDIIALGWKDRFPGKDSHKERNLDFVFENPGYDYHIMSVFLNYRGDMHQVMINCVPEKTDHNEWGNSECHFYGNLKTKEELEKVMMYLGIIEYKS